MPELTQSNFILANELDPSHDRDEMAKARKVQDDGLQQTLIEIKKGLHETEISQELASARKNIQINELSRLQALGIDVSLIKFPQVKEVRGLLNKFGGAHAKSFPAAGEVLVEQSIVEDNEELNNYLKARTLGHEDYHSIAPALYGLHLDSENNVINIRQERQGLAYLPNTSEEDQFLYEGSALEEGLAVEAELRAEKIARQQFPNGAREYDEIVATLKETLPLDPEVPDELIMFVDINRGQRKYDHLYKNSYKLVHLLRQEIHGFDRLVEEARLKHSTLALARAIENRYGKGSYRRITQTSDNDAFVLLNELKNS